MHISIDWFKDLNNKTSSACSASTDVETLPEALAWLKGLTQGVQLDCEHTGQVVVDDYNREDLKAELFRKRTFVVSRKRYEFKDKDDPIYYEYWTGSAWDEYTSARHYESKNYAMSIAEGLATQQAYVYQVEEVDECGFALKEYRV